MSYGDYPDLKDVKRILVVQLRHLGDLLLSSSIFSNLKKRLPEAHIDAYIYKEGKEILKGNRDVSELLLYDRDLKKQSLWKKLFKEWQILSKIRQKKYDLIINLTEGDRGAIACKYSKAKYRIGPDPHNKGFNGKRKYYSHLVRLCGAPRHTVEKNLDFLRRIGIFPTKEDKKLKFFIPEEEKMRMRLLLKENQFEEKKFILIHPFARWKFKCWPIYRMKKLLQTLLNRGEKVVLVSSNDPFEKEMVNDLTKEQNHENLLDLSAKTSIKELGALIEMSKAIICVDSLPLHLASALSAPTVVLFGPTSEKHWGPWMNDKSKVITHNISCRPCSIDGCGGSKMSDCLYAIEEKRVLMALDEIL